MTIIDIGIFAHQEEERIESILRDIGRQTVLSTEGLDVRVIVLANGCRDETVARAQRHLARANVPNMRVEDMPVGGKSRAWNEFVHHLARPDAAFLMFCDADIQLPEPDTMRRLIAFLEERPGIDASSSLPVKDIDFFPQKLTAVERAISAGGGTLGKTRHAICGQLYVMRGPVARSLSIPVGLPVEDGFVRHALITDTFTAPVRYETIDQADDIFHVYGSEREVGSLIRHQVRIVIGGAINAALFRHLNAVGEREGRAGVDGELKRSARDERWLSHMLGAALPRRRFGWVPWPFLNSRIKEHLRAGRFSVRGTGMAVVGFGFDALVYLLAQIKMARGKGAGYW